MACGCGILLGGSPALAGGLETGVLWKATSLKGFGQWSGPAESVVSWQLVVCLSRRCCCPQAGAVGPPSGRGRFIHWLHDRRCGTVNGMIPLDYASPSG
jgi:hypothetical protein